MARIAGVDLPRNKKVIYALPYIFGIGRALAAKIVEESGIDPKKRADDLNEDEVRKIREIIDAKYKVEGDIRREISMNIKRLIDLGSYRGTRHKKGLPVRGQRTHTNARTRKGPRRAIIRKAAAPTG